MSRKRDLIFGASLLLLSAGAGVAAAQDTGRPGEPVRSEHSGEVVLTDGTAPAAVAVVAQQEIAQEASSGRVSPRVDFPSLWSGGLWWMQGPGC